MKNVFFAVLLPFISQVSLASQFAPGSHMNEMTDIVMKLNDVYSGDPKFAECMHKLNFPPKPLSVEGAYWLTLKVAAYAEGLISTCQ